MVFWSKTAMVFAAMVVLAGCGGGSTTTDRNSGSASEQTDAQNLSSGESTSPEKPDTDKGGDQDDRTAADTAGSDEGGGHQDRGDDIESGKADGGAAPGSSDDSASGGGAFRVPGGDNSVQEFGSEANGGERAAASAVLAAYLEARAKGDSKAACDQLAKVTYEQLADLLPKADGDCVAVLSAIDEQTPPSARANRMAGPVGSLRVEGDRAFALFHGTDGADYTIQMTKEGGSWKVASLVPFELP